MNKLKILGFLGIVFIVLGSFILFKNNQKLRKEVDIQRQNVETLLKVRDTLEINNRALFLDIELLNNSNDSIIEELNNVRKSLKIKDKEIESLHKINSVVHKTDSLIIRDTIFKEPDVYIDTTLYDHWGFTNILMKYPSFINVESVMNSDMSIYTFYKKETINKPKKTKIGRFFQKKKKVLEVEVVEHNPNITVKQSKFIKVLK